MVDTRAELLAHPQEAEDAGTPRVQVGESGSALRGLDVVADDAQREDDADADRAAVEAWKVGRVAVWDIRNSGPFHRFTVQDVLVHNCIVDYAGLLKPAKVYDEMRFNLASLWLDFRGLCQEFNVAGWSAAQANRGGAAADLVTMTDIAESFAIVQHIDVGFSISRTPEEIEKNTGRFFVFASRNDKDGTIVNFEADFGRSLIKTTGLYDGASEPAKKGKDSTDQQSEEASFRDAQARMKKEKKEHHGDERQ